MPIKGKERNGSKWKIGVGGTPDSRSGWSDKRGAAKSWEDTHRETTAAALSSWINLQQT